jgi:hypothetical protein
MLGQVLLALGLMLGIFGLAVGILLTVGALEHGHLPLTSLGIGLILGGVLCLELTPRISGNASQGSGEQMGLGPTLIEVLICQAIVILVFAGLLDGGARFRACLYCYLAYLPGAVILLVRRFRALTKVDLVYLKWGWVPIITLGVPLLVRMSKSLI